MIDNLTLEQRRRTMQSIRSRDTQPELKIRQFLHRLGFRFRLHAAELPGKPDIVLRRYKTIVFVNGCFWHRHGCSRSVIPKSHLDYWQPKLARTRERDVRANSALRKLGWTVITVWECEAGREAILRRRFRNLTKAQRTAHLRALNVDKP
jgi:DNA mismatch endonuclease (patch repair protein)